MAQYGARHLLLLYTYTLNRWWRVMMGIGVALLLLVAGLAFLPRLLPLLQIVQVPETTLWVLGSIGAIVVLLAIFLITIRKSAYVQPFENHLRLVTPFLRLKISYRRIRQASSMEINRLYPLGKNKRRKGILKALEKYTAIVLELNALPLPRPALKLFLSPLVFPDRSPRMVLLVPDWIKFSTDLENFRSTWQDTLRQTEADPRGALLSSISRSKR